MIQIKYNQNNKERLELIRFLPFITAEKSLNYFELWLENKYNGEELN